MKKKLIKKIKEIIPADYDLLDEIIIDMIADETIQIFKETINDKGYDFKLIIN